MKAVIPGSAFFTFFYLFINTLYIMSNPFKYLLEELDKIMVSNSSLSGEKLQQAIILADERMKDDLKNKPYSKFAGGNNYSIH